jgi:hypothetical protein
MGFEFSMLVFGVLQRLGQSSAFLKLRLGRPYRKTMRMHWLITQSQTAEQQLSLSRSKETRILLHLFAHVEDNCFVLYYLMFVTDW